MKYYLTILLLFTILFTGCLDANNDPGCTPVDQSAVLADYENREGFVKSDSGLIYRVVDEGDVEIPEDIRYVFLTLKGKLVSGDVIEETEELIFVDRFNVPLLGIREGLAMMKEGSTYELVIPPELAFGNNPPDGSIIQCGAVVIYEITLDSFLRDPATFLEQNANNEGVVQTESGLQYRVIEEGEGETAGENSTVRVLYEGKLTNNYVFDGTNPNSPAEFGISSPIISGFAEGLQLMNEGSTYQFFIPPGLAYGDNPPRDPRTGVLVLPPNAILIFEVEMVEIR